MSTRDLKAHILPGLIAGARGLALERAGVATPLQALALTAQALRFERPVAPAAFQIAETINDSRALVPDAVRRPLIRLLAMKTQGLAPNVLPDAVARALAAKRLRLHPFDLVRLDGFVRAHAEQLGAEAVAFAERQAPPEQRRGYFEAEALDDATWNNGTPAQRQVYIAGRRREDPGAARGLVETVWANEPADTRVRLLTALMEGLGPDDATFLNGLAKDRAPRVRELAERYLARLPGHDGDHPALRAVVARIKAKQIGFLTKRTTLTLELPATVKPGSPAWIGQAFGDIGLDELARALSRKVEDLPGAAEEDDNLLVALAIMATRDKRLDILQAVAGYLPDVWEQLMASGIDDLDGFSVDERARWAETVVLPETWLDMPVWRLTRLPGLLEGPAPDALMRKLLDARPWRALREDEAKIPDGLVDVLVALSPASQRPDLRAQLAPLDPARVNRALLFLDIMDALEAPNV